MAPCRAISQILNAEREEYSLTMPRLHSEGPKYEIVINGKVLRKIIFTPLFPHVFSNYCATDNGQLRFLFRVTRRIRSATSHVLQTSGLRYRLTFCLVKQWPMDIEAKDLTCTHRRCRIVDDARKEQ